MNFKKAFPYIVLIVLALIAMALKKCNNNNSKKTKPSVDDNTYDTRGLNRNPAAISYTKHAKCRMECRHIDETEVKDILEHGKINYNKSDLKGNNCYKKYAVEGYSKDNQHLRIIFAPCNNEVKVITCIDMGVEWECHCEGDE